MLHEKITDSQRANEMYKAHQERTYDLGDLINWAFTAEGLVRVFHFSLSLINPDITVNDAVALIGQDNEQCIRVTLKALGQDLDDMLKNAQEAKQDTPDVKKKPTGDTS